MLSGGAMPTDSLLPDNPAARIMPVQGGGAMPKSDAILSGNRKPAGWHSTPIIIPVSANSVEELNSPPLALKNYKEKWRRTLGPSVPSRHRPRQDPYIVIGSLDVTISPTYAVAPLRGDIDAAKDTLFWTNELLKQNPKAYVAFMGPLTEGGPRADGDLILKMLESLMSSYPGHVMYVSNDTSTSRDSSVSQLPGSLDGLVLYAMPHTSKQIIFGFIPDEDEVYSSSVRNLDSLEVETVRIPADAKTKRKEGERMLTIQFSKAKTAYNRTKQPRSQMVRDNRKWNAPPGWVSQISYQTKDGSVTSQIVQEGGKDTDDEVPVLIGGKPFKIRPADKGKSDWENGKFTDNEQSLLEDMNLKFSNEIYALFLEGLFNSKCKTSSNIDTNPQCGTFRYLMSLAYFNKLEQAQKNPPLSVNVKAASKAAPGKLGAKVTFSESAKKANGPLTIKTPTPGASSSGGSPKPAASSPKPADSSPKPADSSPKPASAPGSPKPAGGPAGGPAEATGADPSKPAGGPPKPADSPAATSPKPASGPAGGPAEATDSTAGGPPKPAATPEDDNNNDNDNDDTDENTPKPTGPSIGVTRVGAAVNAAVAKTAAAGAAAKAKATAATATAAKPTAGAATAAAPTAPTAPTGPVTRSKTKAPMKGGRSKKVKVKKRTTAKKGRK